MAPRVLPAEGGTLRGDVLARLLVVQQALDVLPGDDELTSFLDRALEQVPGVAGAVLFLDGGRRAASETALETACAAAWAAVTGFLPGDPLPGLPSSAAFPIRTLRRAYGLLALELDDPAEFGPYLPVVANVAGSVGAGLETRELLRMTSSARAELEGLVATRTGELADRTERLEREMAEKDAVLAALAESEERLRLVAANAQDAIVLMDEGGRVTMWNAAAERIFGRSRAEMIGQDVHEVLAPPRFLEASRRGLAAFARFGIGPFVGRSIELTAVRPSGAEFPVEVSVSPVRVRGAWHAIGIVRDITDRKRGDAVRDALAAIVRSTTDAVVGKTTNGVVTSWNAGAERLYGFRASEMIGRLLSSIAPPGRGDEIARLSALVVQGQIVEDYETQRIHRSGRVLDVSLTLAPIHDDAGVVVGISTIARDITRRKEAERALRESEARLEEAQRIARLGRWEWSIADDVVELAAETFAIWGTTPPPAPRTADGTLRIVHPDDRDRVALAVRRVVEGGGDLSIDFRVVLPDASVRHAHGTGQLRRDEAGNPRKVVGTIQDVTERKEAELALRRKNRALRTLSSCNQTLVRAASEDELLDGMCTILVEEGGFRRAWVGLAAGEARGLVPACCRCRGADGRASGAVGDLVPGSPEHGFASAAASARAPRIDAGRPVGDPDPGGGDEGPTHGRAAMAAVPLVLEEGVLGVLVLHADEPGTFDDEEIGLVSELASDLAFGIEALRARSERKVAALEKQQYLVQIRQNLEETVATIAATVEARDPYTAGHQRRVAAFAAAIARETGLDEEAVQGIHLAGTIHDLGKIKVPAEILARPGQLSEIEERIIQIHPEAGWEILKGVGFPWPIAEMVLQHHERLDGSGYPRGLRGDEISLGARILAVADVVEAMASHRPYRPSRGLDAALSQVESERGVHFDAVAVDACLALCRERGYRLDA
ncbi:MAG: PAS domain S-box protein [Thermoanaerobaculia bacterium]|jgi:PAS domain S-box-containing protein|nr:PAS domain S-box protein [Thermoanaerobaculia bacterium]